MRKRTKLVAAWLAALAIAPVIAAGRPACCIKPQVAPAASHSCCPAPDRPRASALKGCCKAPVAPKPETRANAGAPTAVATAPLDVPTPAASLAALPPAVSIRLARRAHHAEAPDDSPPDRLSRLHVLLI